MERRTLIGRVIMVAIVAAALFIGWTMANNAGTRGTFKARLADDKALAEDQAVAAERARAEQANAARVGPAGPVPPGR